MLQIKETRVSMVERRGETLLQVVIVAKVGTTRVSVQGHGLTFEDAREEAFAALNERLQSLGEPPFLEGGPPLETVTSE